jgi:pimeloyl-ACP methyl ester carboxylesterase
MTVLHLTDSRIDTDAVTLHVEQAGTGAPALVFLHYWGGSSRTWHPVIARLAGTARCVAIDHRGWGRSDAPTSAYATGDMAADATAVITALGLDDYIVVGHSMGGKVAQLLATRRPRGLRGLVLVAPAPARPAPIPDVVRAQMRAAYESRASVEATLDGVLRHAPLDDELREQVVQDSLAGAPAAKDAWPAHTIGEDGSGELDRIEVPVLVLTGEHDRVEPAELMRSHVLPHIPGATLEIVPGSGHLMPLEQPGALSARIAAFRDAVTTGSRRPGGQPHATSTRTGPRKTQPA